MAIVQISGTINSSFSVSGVLVNAAQAAGDAVFTIDLRPTNPIALVQDNLDYGVLGWNIANVVATIILIGPQGEIYRNENFLSPDIIPAVSRYLNKTITMPLDPLTNYTNILKGNYTLKITWYNSVLDEYYTFLKTYQYNLVPPIIDNTTVSGPYTGTLTSTDTSVYSNNGNTVHQIIREHRIKYPTQLSPVPDDIVSSNAVIQVTPIYTNQWTIEIGSFVEYRNSDLLRIFWEGSGTFTHCVYGGCIGAMYDVINTMLTTYADRMACNINNQEFYQKRLVILNTAWHLLNQAYWLGDAEEADAQSYVIQEQVEYTGAGICGGATSELVVPCPPWTGGGIGGTYTFSNGLTESVGNVVWGGILTQNTTITAGGYGITFTGVSASNSFDVVLGASVSPNYIKKSNGSAEGSVEIGNGSVTLKYVDLITPLTRSYTLSSSAGLQEDSDYTASYTARTLVAKSYVDDLFGSIVGNTFQNGLTLAAGIVTLGGILTGNTNIYGAYQLNIGSGTPVTSFLASAATTAGIAVGSSLLQAGSNSAIVRANDGSLNKDIILSATSMLVTDAQDQKGLEYLADYSVNWTDHSLVTKKWVTDNFVAVSGSGTFIGLTDTPASYSGFANYFLRVNSGGTGIVFVPSAWVPVTGGTFTGPVGITSSTDRLFILRQAGTGGAVGTPEGGTNLISFQDGDGDEQGYIGIDASGNVVLRSWVTGAGILIDSDLEVNGDIIVTGTVDGVDIAAWKTSYDIKEVNWDEAYSWGDHAGLYQPLDSDLTAIAALGFTTEAFLKKTALNTWVLDTNIYATKDYVDSLALTYVYLPTTTTVVVSDGYTGDNDSVQVIGDSDILQVEELNATPAMDIRFEFTDVATFNNLLLYLYYHGGSGHIIQVQFFNNDTLSWDTATSFIDQTAFTLIDVPLPYVTPWVNGSDEVTMRLYHPDPGNTAHYFEIDFISIRLTPQLGGGGGGGVSDHGGLTGLADDDHTQYALADGSRCIYYVPSGAKQSSVDAGTFGQTSVDDDYIYICVQTGSAGSAIWKKVSISQSP